MINRITLLLFLGLAWGQDEWNYYTADPIIHDVYDYQDYVWVISDYDGEKIVKINKQSGVQEFLWMNNSFNEINTIFIDDVGVWIGGLGSSDGPLGLIEHYDYPYQIHRFWPGDQGVSFGANKINDITYDITNNKYLLATDVGVVYFEQIEYLPGDDITITFNQVGNYQDATAIYADSIGYIYSAYVDGYVQLFEYADSLNNYYVIDTYHSNNSALTGNPVIDIDIDSEGRMWAISSEPLEVFSYDGTLWQYFNQYNSPIVDSLSFTVLEIDDNDNIFIGSEYNGIYEYDGTNWTILNSENSGLMHNNVKAIHKDSQSNTKWIGTWAGGLAAYNEEGFNLKINDNLYGLNYFKLFHAYPNPFNPVTTLRYDLPEYENVNITIYDMMGRQVKTLINGSQTAGYKSIQWDATNNTGQPVSAGLYLYTIEAGKFRQTKKMVLLK
jgi:hypothetical protein